MTRWYLANWLIVLSYAKSYALDREQVCCMRLTGNMHLITKVYGNKEDEVEGMCSITRGITADMFEKCLQQQQEG